MTQKLPDGLSKILGQLTQAWEKAAPVLKLQLLKLLQSLIPALEKLSQQVATPENQAGWRSQASKLFSAAIASLEKLKVSLSQEVSSPSELSTVETSPAEAQPALPAGEALPGSWEEAKKFSKEKLIPTVLTYLTQAVEWLEPRLAPIWSKVAAKAKDTPALVNAWSKVQSNSLWQKGITALAPVRRFVTEKLEPAMSSEQLKPILAKRVAVNTILAVLVLFFLFKPSILPKVAKVTPKAPVASRPAGNNFSIPPEKGDSPISADQIMIADIQSQVASVSKKYGEALIASVQTNFKLGRLIVQLSDAWYQLTPQRQEQLMADLLQRSQSLNFKKLLIADSTSHLLARSPAVGSDMVILRR